MTKGYVYILSNASMPGLFKVGMTTRTPEGRAAELFQTGLPTPFLVEESFYFPDCAAAELDVHQVLAESRVSPDREFFNAPLMEINLAILTVHMSQIRDFVYEFNEYLTVVDAGMEIDEITIARFTTDFGVHWSDITSVIDCLELKDIKNAIVKNDEKKALRKKRQDAGIGLGSLNPDDIEREIAAKSRTELLSEISPHGPTQ